MATNDAAWDMNKRWWWTNEGNQSCHLFGRQFHVLSSPKTQPNPPDAIGTRQSMEFIVFLLHFSVQPNCEKSCYQSRTGFYNGSIVAATCCSSLKSWQQPLHTCCHKEILVKGADDDDVIGDTCLLLGILPCLLLRRAIQSLSRGIKLALSPSAGAKF
jgi:hypothetical protein